MRTHLLLTRAFARIVLTATIDKVLVRSPDVYARFVNHLEYIIREGLPSAYVADIAERQIANIFGLLDNKTAAGLSEMTAINPDAALAVNARTEIADTAHFYQGWLEERRAYLLHLIRIYRARTGSSPSPVVIVDGIAGDYVPGAILAAPLIPPAPPRVARARVSNAAPASARLMPACAALAAGKLQASLQLHCEGYTSSCQELLIAPRIRVTGSSAVSLAGLRLGLTFDRVVLDEMLPGAAPTTAPNSDFTTLCYTGGITEPQDGFLKAEESNCVQYAIRAAVSDDRIEIAFGNGSLCAGCALDLGADDALVGVWHSRWLTLTNATAYQPLPPACDQAPAAPAKARQLADATAHADADAGPDGFQPSPPQEESLPAWLAALRPSQPQEACAAWQARLLGCSPAPEAASSK